MTFNINNPNVGAEIVKNVILSPLNFIDKLLTKSSDKAYNKEHLGKNELSLIKHIKHKESKKSLKYIKGKPTKILWMITIRTEKYYH